MYKNTNKTGNIAPYSIINSAFFFIINCWFHIIIKQYDNFKSKVASLVTSVKCIQEITIYGDILKTPPQLLLFTIVINKTINKYCCFINIHRH